MKKYLTTILLSLSMNGQTALKGETLNAEVSQKIISKAIECGRKSDPEGSIYKKMERAIRMSCLKK